MENLKSETFTLLKDQINSINMMNLELRYNQFLIKQLKEDKEIDWMSIMIN